MDKIRNETIRDASSITNDTYNNNSSNISKREFRKNTFLSLVTENSKLLENEKIVKKDVFMNAINAN